MADNFIAISNSSRLGTTLLGIVCNLATDVAKLKQLKADMDQMTDTVTYATIEAQFGLPTGKGQTIYLLLSGLLTDLAASSNYATLPAFLGATQS